MHYITLYVIDVHQLEVLSETLSSLITLSFWQWNNENTLYCPLGCSFVWMYSPGAMNDSYMTLRFWRESVQKPTSLPDERGLGRDVTSSVLMTSLKYLQKKTSEAPWTFFRNIKKHLKHHEPFSRTLKIIFNIAQIPGVRSSVNIHNASSLGRHPKYEVAVLIVVTILAAILPEGVHLGDIFFGDSWSHCCWVIKIFWKSCRFKIINDHSQKEKVH